MRIVVTGGSGFVGSHLVDLLLDQGKEVVVVDVLSNHSNTDIVNKKVTHFFSDMSDPDVLKKIIKKDDRVIHLAAQSHVDVSFSKPHQTILSNVLATENVMRACKENEAEKILIMSTDEVYGSKDKVLDFNLLDPTNPYSASKAAGDMIVNSYKHMYPDMHVNTLRSNNIAGPRQFIRNIIPRFSCLALMGKKMTIHGNGSSERRYLWVKDAVTALSMILEKGINGKIYHTSHHNKYTNLEIAEKIGSYLDLEDFIEFLPDRVFNDTTYPFFKDMDIEADTGWKVTKELDNYLPETIEWYRKNLDMYKGFIK